MKFKVCRKFLSNNMVTEFQALLVSQCKYRVEGMRASVVMDAVAHDRGAVIVPVGGAGKGFVDGGGVVLEDVGRMYTYL